MCIKEKIDKEKDYSKKLELLRTPLLSFIKGKVFNCADANDIVQDTLVILHQKELEYDSNKSLLSWGTRIANYQIMAYFSSIKRNKEDISNGQDDSLISKLERSNVSVGSWGHFIQKMPFQDIIESEKQKVFDQIKMILSKRERDIIDLSLQGWSADDIVYNLKTSRNAYTTSKSRAIKKMKAFFKTKDSSNYKL